MKKMILLLVFSVFSILSFSQDKIYKEVYSKINSERSKAGLSRVKKDEPLELASAQHGCWLAMYNLNKPGVEIELPSEEFRIEMVATFTTIADRVRNYTNRDYTFLTQKIAAFSEQPNSTMILDTIREQMMSKNITYVGFWIIKFENKMGDPVWYLVCLTSN